ncbi:MAG TPA: hypothetical protein VJK03_04810 [Candidatus Nanoarchaeia archaeon]|nr:hypothetical protein [Candidatus Nanoarchaeia archaeon]
MADFQKLLAYARIYAKENENWLRKRYGNRYIAIEMNKGVIMVDSDKKRLLRNLPDDARHRERFVSTLGALLSEDDNPPADMGGPDIQPQER